jgi:CSLREA domain-containing protein
LSTTPRLAALITVIALAGATAGSATPAHATSFTVNTTHDAVDITPGDGACADSGGTCTLRAAIEETNALSGPDAVAVPAGTYQLTHTITVQGKPVVASIAIRGDLTLNGSGPAATIVDGGGQTGVLGVGRNAATPISVEITDLSVRNGNSLTGAGGIDTLDSATLTMRRVAVMGSSGVIGGIRARGTVNIFDSLIAGNAGDPNGGILVRGPVTITNSTISGNQAPAAGGINVESGSATLNNATVALNTNGGALGAVHAKNSIFANNGAPDCIVSEGHNLVTSPCASPAASDLAGADPQLTGLQENGGPTLTHGLYPNSPAIDAGDPNGCPPTDQRAVARPQGAACDIGAYEYVTPPTQPPTAPPATPPPPPPPTATNTPTLNLTTGSTRPSTSPSPSPTTAASTATSPAVRKVLGASPAAAVLVDAPEPVEETTTGVSLVASGLAIAGVLGLIGSVAGGGYYWYSTHRKRPTPP